MKLSEGIIVKSIKFQESSKIITIVNEEGLSTYFVKGAANYKSRNFSYSNELTKIAYDFNQKTKDSLKILTTGNIIDNYSNIKQSFEKLNDCFLIIELINHLGNHISDFKTLYNFIDDILKIINEREYSEYYYIIFRLKLLYLLGIGPIFSRCVNCNNQADLIGFVYELGGMCCKNCLGNNYKTLSNELTEVIQFLYLTKLNYLTCEVISKIKYDGDLINKFLDNYYEHFLGFRSKASKVIKNMQK